MSQYATISRPYCGWQEISWLISPYLIYLGEVALAGVGLYILLWLTGFKLARRNG